jgi:hypothetical protein
MGDGKIERNFLKDDGDDNLRAEAFVHHNFLWSQPLLPNFPAFSLRKIRIIPFEKSVTRKMAGIAKTRQRMKNPFIMQTLPGKSIHLSS